MKSGKPAVIGKCAITYANPNTPFIHNPDKEVDSNCQIAREYAHRFSKGDGFRRIHHHTNLSHGPRQSWLGALRRARQHAAFTSTNGAGRRGPPIYGRQSGY
jgi:hypothetical protein